MHFKFLIACCIAFIPVIRVVAQCSTAQPTLTISSDPCTGSVITFNTNILPSSVSWYNGATLLTTKTTIPPSTATTVAGGNGAGAAANQLSRPDRLFVTANGTIYVPDLDNNRIQKWLPGATSGITVAGGNGAGSAANQFNRPSSVFVDQQGNLYVTDQSNGRVQKWAPGATQGVTVAGAGLDYLGYPTDVFVDKQGNIYVSDQYGAAVKMWAPGATTAVIVAGTGNYTAGPQGLESPTGIFVDDDGTLYVCDTDNNRVMKWPRGATTGIPVAGGAYSGNYGSANNEMRNPLDVAVDCKGNVYIADYGNHRIQKWLPGATEGITVAGGNGQGSGANQLNNPIGIFLDSVGNIYVADYSNNRVQKFTNTIENTYTATVPGKYTVTAVFACCTISSDTIVISDPTEPVVTITSDTTRVCLGKGAVIYTAKPVHGGSTPVYRWFKNDLATNITTATYTDNNAANGDRMYCMLTSSDRCVSTPIAISNTITISAYQSVPLNLGADQTICPGSSATITIPQGYHNYNWYDGSTAASITVTAAGKYYAQVTDVCDQQYSDTILVKNFTVASSFLPADTTICSYDKLQLKPDAAFTSFLWNNHSTDPEITAGAGTFWLRGTDKNNCITSDTIIIASVRCPARGFYIPNAFTPNSDGKNDLFKPTFYGLVTNYRFAVFNRLGQQLFSSSKLNEGWDGTTKGKYFDMTVFIWSCQYQIDGGPLQQKQGTVTLVR